VPIENRSTQGSFAFHRDAEDTPEPRIAGTLSLRARQLQSWQRTAKFHFLVVSYNKQPELVTRECDRLSSFGFL
jgi:hypothetical protein